MSALLAARVAAWCLVGAGFALLIVSTIVLYSAGVAFIAAKRLGE